MGSHLAISSQTLETLPSASPPLDRSHTASVGETLSNGYHASSPCQHLAGLSALREKICSHSFYQYFYIMDMLRVMEGVAFVTTVAMFLTGIPPCINMYSTGDTKNVPYLMFLLSTISCFSMSHYGVILGLMSIVILNVMGCLLNAAYTGAYILVIKEKNSSITYLSLCVAFMAVLYGYLYTMFTDEAARAPIIGATGSGITTFLMCLPAIELVDNLRNHNTDGMPPIMLFGTILCGGSWLIYGLMLNDINIYLPNIPGLTLSFAKLAVIYSFSETKSEKKKQ